MSTYDRKLYGEQLFRLTPDRCPRRVGEIPVLTQRWQAYSETQFQLGEEPDGWPGMRITMIDAEEEIPGEAYILNIEAEGLPDSDGVTAKILAHDEDLPQQGWDTVSRRIYTSDPNDTAYLKGGQIMGTPVTGVTGEADDEIFTKAAHGLVSGQLADFTFSSGFGGCTSGTRYLITRLSADTLRLADPSLIQIVTGAHSTDLITSRPSTDATQTEAHGFTDGTAVIFAILRGGAGLSTHTVYYVRDATSTTFKLATTPGGTAINFTSNITGYSTIVPIVTLSSDGTGGTLTPVMLGYERLWVTDRRKSKARGCVEAEDLGLAGYHILDLQLMGLNQVTGEVKHPVRTINASAQALRIENFTPVLFTGHPVYTGSTDDTLDQDSTHNYSLTGNVDFDLSQTQLNIVYISIAPPPTWMLGSGYRWVPTDAPPVTIIGLSGSNDTIHFPNGWKLGNLQSSQIPGQQLYLTSVNLIYQRGTTPGE